MDRGMHAKLYVSPISETATEEDIRFLFEGFGNIVEIVLLRDKKTGQRQGSCFVKFSSADEADYAISSLHNQCYFPGIVDPLKVKYAVSERERLGNIGGKLYVSHLNKHASKKEIEEIFSPYGSVEEIYIMLDEMRQNRGSGFIKFTQRDMALAAVNALNGAYTMRGCDQPLIVRFADSKRPRNGESRLGHKSEDSVGGHDSYPALQRNRHVPVLHWPKGSASETVWEMVDSHRMPSGMQQMHHQFQVLPPQLTETIQESCRSLSGPPEMHKELEVIQPSIQNAEHQNSFQVTSSRSSKAESNSHKMETTSAAPAPAPVIAASISSNNHTADPFYCEWSEHISPDGCEYYYNRVTHESRWEKPEEFFLFQQRIE